MKDPLVTIITATTCSDYLRQNLESVQKQTYKNIQHLIFIDGRHHLQKANFDLDLTQDVIILPYPTGTDNYNGHRMYAAGTFLAKGDYIVYLDEDNWLEPNHVESLVECTKPNTWSCSLRKITDMEGNFVCNDDCESLGNWESVIGDYFVDVNCYFLPKIIAIQLAPLWYRRARHPEEQPEVDRLLTMMLRHNKIDCTVSGLYTVNYRAGNRTDSVQPAFFIEGNKKMQERYKDFPWRKV